MGEFAALNFLQAILQLYRKNAKNIFEAAGGALFAPAGTSSVTLIFRGLPC
jgi:hypothetical protein